MSKGYYNEQYNRNMTELSGKQYSQTELVEMDPLELVEVLKNMIAGDDVPTGLETDADRDLAVRIMNVSTAHQIYFDEMRLRASILKKESKASKDNDKFQHYLMVEDVFETYSGISKKRFDNVSRLITLKKTELEEARMLGTAT